MRWQFPALLAVLTACNDNSVKVLSNKTPEVSIVSPVQNAVLLEGQETTLTGTVYDPDTAFEDLNVYWESGLSGVLTGTLEVEENTVSLKLPQGLSMGDHTLSLIAVDPESSSATATVSVTSEPNTAPTVQIVAPDAGATLSNMTTHTLVTAVSDAHTPVGDLLLLWESSLDGELAGQTEVFGNTVTFEVDSGLSTGDHTLSVKAIDPQGASASDTVDITVGGNTPPTIAFNYPDTDTVYGWNDVVFVEIQVSDDQADLSTVALTWSGMTALSWVDDTLPENPTSSGVASASITLDCIYYDTANEYEFVLTATAMDDTGLTGQKSTTFKSHCQPLD